MILWLLNYLGFEIKRACQSEGNHLEESVWEGFVNVEKMKDTYVVNVFFLTIQWAEAIFWIHSINKIILKNTLILH